MKKIFVSFFVILLLSGCGLKNKGLDDQTPQVIHSGEKEANPMTAMQKKVKTTVQDFAIQIGMKKEDTTVGQFDYLNGTKKEGFQIVNPNYPREKYGEIEKIFTGWEMPISPADGIAESMMWYQKDAMMCKLHIKLNATQEEIDNDEIQDKNYTVDITCFYENKSQNKKVSQAQKKVQEFADSIFMKNAEVTPKDFKWLTKDGVVNIKGFTTKNSEYYETDSSYANIFEVDGWKFDDSNLADGSGESVVGYKRGNSVCLVSNSVNATIKQINESDDLSNFSSTLEISCGENPQNLSSETKTEKNNSEKKERIYLSAYGIEPVWNIDIKGNTLTNFGTDPEKGTDYHIDTIQTGKDKIIFEGEYVKAIFEKTSCISDGLGVEVPYKVQFILEKDMVFNGCGDEALDEFFVEGKQGSYKELAQKIGLEKNSQKNEVYKIGKIDGPYFSFRIKYDGTREYNAIYKKTSSGYVLVWEGQDVTIKQCVNIINNHSKIAYNPDFPFSDCEERLKNAKGDEIDEIYENKNIQTEEDKEKQEDCEESALSLIRRTVEVKTYIEDMEDYISPNSDEETKNNAREVGGISNSLVDFHLVLEQEDNTALLFVLKEIHKEEDGIERESVTKRFKIENLDLMPQEYVTELDEYNELTPTTTEAELQKLKSQYKKDCGIK